MTEQDELIAHQIEMIRLLHKETGKVNQKLLIMIVIMLVGLIFAFWPALFEPFYDWLNYGY